MLFRNIFATLFVLSCMTSSYFYALDIPWLPVMCLAAAVAFLMLAIGCHNEGM